jgi:pimeloyl-ACP methyl ester carboxylesterase
MAAVKTNVRLGKASRESSLHHFHPACRHLHKLFCIRPPRHACRSERILSARGSQNPFQANGHRTTCHFSHGFGTSLDTWRFVIETLEDEFRLVLLDLKGHGLSDRPRDEMYAAQDHARVVQGLIDYLGLDNVMIVGHSFGSVVRLAAALHAQRDGSSGVIAALVLIAGSVDAENVPFVLRLLRTPILGWLTLKLTSASFRTRLMLKHAYYEEQGYGFCRRIVCPLSIHPWN